jgi:hypothetical protein
MVNYQTIAALVNQIPDGMCYGRLKSAVLP